MKITEFIPQNGIFCEIRARDKWAFFSEVSEALARALNRPAEEIERVLVERERLSTTAIGDEVAIPHSRMSGLEKMVVAVARKKEGLDFEALDKKPVKLIFVVLAPEGEANTYLKTLAYLARILSNEEIKKKLLEAPSEKEILKILDEVEYEY